MASWVRLTVLDFNGETVQSTEELINLDTVEQIAQRGSPLLGRSVFRLIFQSGRSIETDVVPLEYLLGEDAWKDVVRRSVLESKKPSDSSSG